MWCGPTALRLPGTPNNSCAAKHNSPAELPSGCSNPKPPGPRPFHLALGLHHVDQAPFSKQRGADVLPRALHSRTTCSHAVVAALHHAGCCAGAQHPRQRRVVSAKKHVPTTVASPSPTVSIRENGLAVAPNREPRHHLLAGCTGDASLLFRFALVVV